MSHQGAQYLRIKHCSASGEASMKLPFTYDGRQLEVHALGYDGLWILSVYENEVAINGLQYQVDGSAELGAEGSDLLDRLMATMAEDFCKSSDRRKAAAPAEPPLNDENIVKLVAAQASRGERQ